MEGDCYAATNSIVFNKALKNIIGGNMNRIQQLHKIGQSIWLDNIERSLITSGRLAELVDMGIRGVTSNPSIFEKAIVGGAAYDDDIAKLASSGKSAMKIYEAVAVEDISLAADVLRKVFNESCGEDGYVSLEVSPLIADDTETTISEARRLFKLIDRPNIMIKVPATREGMPAVRKLIGEGININATLIFSVSQYEEIAEAYISGIEDLIAAGGDPSSVASVASIFVSRLDGKIDPILESMGIVELRGEIAIANSTSVYSRFKEIFAGERWQALSEKGARVQRVLWASTGTKNPEYSDLLYVYNLVGPQTVNTLPGKTLDALIDHLLVEETIMRDPESAKKAIERLPQIGIDLDKINDMLLQEGVEKFAVSFNSLIDSIESAMPTDNLLNGFADSLH